MHRCYDFLFNWTIFYWLHRKYQSILLHCELPSMQNSTAYLGVAAFLFMQIANCRSITSKKKFLKSEYIESNIWWQPSLASMEYAKTDLNEFLFLPFSNVNIRRWQQTAHIHIIKKPTNDDCGKRTGHKNSFDVAAIHSYFDVLDGFVFILFLILSRPFVHSFVDTKFKSKWKRH